MKIIFVLSGLLMTLISDAAYAAQCPALSGCGNNPIDAGNGAQGTCGGTSPSKYCTQGGGREWVIASCQYSDGTPNCGSGYHAVTKTSDVIGCTFKYIECERDATVCGDWQHDTIDTAYDFRECGSVYELRCHSGYYGTPPNFSMDYNGDWYGCTKCSENASCPGGTAMFICLEGYYQNGNVCSDCPGSGYSKMGATDIQQCYIMSYTPFSDDSGSGYYTADCYYTK